MSHLLQTHDKVGRRKSEYKLSWDRYLHERIYRDNHPLDISGDKRHTPTLTDCPTRYADRAYYREELTPIITETLLQKSLHIPSAARHLLLRIDAWHTFILTSEGHNPRKHHPETHFVPIDVEKQHEIQMQEFRRAILRTLTEYIRYSLEKLAMLQVVGEALDMEVTYREILLPQHSAWSIRHQKVVPAPHIDPLGKLPPLEDPPTLLNPDYLAEGLYRRYIFDLVEKEKKNEKRNPDTG